MIHYKTSLHRSAEPPSSPFINMLIVYNKTYSCVLMILEIKCIQLRDLMHPDLPEKQSCIRSNLCAEQADTSF